MKQNEKRFRFKNIEFAPKVAIEQYDDIAETFFKRIFNIDYANVGLSDLSSITDFMDIFIDDRRAEKDFILNKIKEVYDIDVSDIDDLLLVKIFERISILGR